MKKLLRWAVGIILVLLACVSALLLAKDSILRRIAESRIRQKTGLVTHIGELRAPLGTATLAIRDFRLMNPPGFGTNALVNVPELFMRVDPNAAASGGLRIRELRIHLEELNVVRDANDRVNLEVLESRIGENSSTNASPATNRASAGLAFGGIDRLQLTLGRLRYTDLAHPRKNRLVALDVHDEIATNLRTTEDLTNWVATFVVRLVMREIFGRDQGSFDQPETTVGSSVTNRSGLSLTPAP